MNLVAPFGLVKEGRGRCVPESGLTSAVKLPAQRGGLTADVVAARRNIPASSCFFPEAKGLLSMPDCDIIFYDTFNGG